MIGKKESSKLFLLLCSNLTHGYLEATITVKCSNKIEVKVVGKENQSCMQRYSDSELLAHAKIDCEIVV